MALSKTYLEMTPIEKISYMGRVVIAAQSEELFLEMKELIGVGLMIGLYQDKDAGDLSSKQIADLDNPIENGPSKG